MVEEEDIFVSISVELTSQQNDLSKIPVLLFRNHETYDSLTNKNNVAVFNNIPVGIYNVKVDYEGYLANADYITVSVENDYFVIKLDEVDECNKIKSRNNNCKHFHQDPYWTPNNYELYFDYNAIPSNIEIESQHDLRRLLQKKLPLSKILHLMLESENTPQNNTFNVHTKTFIKFKVKEDNKEVIVKRELK